MQIKMHKLKTDFFIMKVKSNTGSKSNIIDMPH